MVMMVVMVMMVMVMMCGRDEGHPGKGHPDDHGDDYHDHSGKDTGDAVKSVMLRYSRKIAPFAQLWHLSAVW